MKKRSLFLIAALLTTLITGVSSCSKNVCTNPNAPNFNQDGSCIDATASLVGVYNGSIQDSIVNVNSTYLTSQQVTITSIDFSHIMVTASNGGSLTQFTASVAQQGSNYTITISSQSSGTSTLIGYATGVSSGFSGYYNSTSKTFASTTLITGNTGTVTIEGFSGVKQ